MKETEKLTMVIQEKRCAFGTLTDYENEDGMIRANIKVEKGILKSHDPILVLSPFDVLVHGIGTTTS